MAHTYCYVPTHLQTNSHCSLTAAVFPNRMQADGPAGDSREGGPTHTFTYGPSSSPPLRSLFFFSPKQHAGYVRGVESSLLRVRLFEVWKYVFGLDSASLVLCDRPSPAALRRTRTNERSPGYHRHHHVRMGEEENQPETAKTAALLLPPPPPPLLPTVSGPNHPNQPSPLLPLPQVVAGGGGK